jgi:hypothetical protein
MNGNQDSVFALPTRATHSCPTVAKRWGYAGGTVARWVREGRIPVVWLGEKPRIEDHVARSLPDYIKPRAA